MICCSGTGTTGGIGAGSGNGNSCQSNQSVRHRIGRHPHRNCLQTSCGSIGNPAAFGENHGKRPRPEGFHQLLTSLRHIFYKRFYFFRTGNMGNQRIVRRPALGCINLFCSILIQSISSQSVYSFRRKGHKTAPADDFCRLQKLLIPYMFCILYINSLCLHHICTSVFFPVFPSFYHAANGKTISLKYQSPP